MNARRNVKSVSPVWRSVPRSQSADWLFDRFHPRTGFKRLACASRLESRADLESGKTATALFNAEGPKGRGRPQGGIQRCFGLVVWLFLVATSGTVGASPLVNLSSRPSSGSSAFVVNSKLLLRLLPSGTVVASPRASSPDVLCPQGPELAATPAESTLPWRLDPIEAVSKIAIRAHALGYKDAGTLVDNEVIGRIWKRARSSQTEVVALYVDELDRWVLVVGDEKSICS